MPSRRMVAESSRSGVRVPALESRPSLLHVCAYNTLSALETTKFNESRTCTSVTISDGSRAKTRRPEAACRSRCHPAARLCWTWWHSGVAGRPFPRKGLPARGDRYVVFCASGLCFSCCCSLFFSLSRLRGGGTSCAFVCPLEWYYGVCGGVSQHHRPYCTSRFLVSQLMMDRISFPWVFKPRSASEAILSFPLDRLANQHMPASRAGEIFPVQPLES